MGLAVVRQHAAVVHLVDVIAGENDHVRGLLAPDRINILVDGVGGAHVPVGPGPLHRRHQLKELAQLLGHNARPAFADVPVQRLSALYCVRIYTRRRPELMQLESVMSMMR